MLQPMLGNAAANDQQMAQEDYASQAATKANREMSMALMNRSATKELPKHWAQLLGNVANDAAGAYLYKKANEVGRNSVKKDSGTFIDQMWGANGQGAVPFAPKAPGSGGGLGMPPGMGGVAPGLPAQAGWQDPTMPVPQGMPSGAPVQFMGGPNGGGGPLGTPPPTGQGGPFPGGIFGGKGWEPAGWSQGIYDNPQG